MTRLPVLLLTAWIMTGAEDPWIKVRETKSGTELRIVRVGAKQPILAKMDEAVEDKLLVVVKDAQIAIPKNEIERIDHRPLQTSSRFVRENRTTTTMPEKVVSGTRPSRPNVPGASASTGVTIGSRPDFELLYRRIPTLADLPATR